MNSIHKILTKFAHQQSVDKSDAQAYMVQFSTKTLAADFQQFSCDKESAYDLLRQNSDILVQRFFNSLYIADPASIPFIFEYILYSKKLNLWNRDFMFHQKSSNPFFVEHFHRTTTSTNDFMRHIHVLSLMDGDDLIDGIINVCRSNTHLMYIFLMHDYFYKLHIHHTELLSPSNLTRFNHQDRYGRQLLLAFTDTLGESPDEIVFKTQIELFGNKAPILSLAPLNHSETEVFF